MPSPIDLFENEYIRFILIILITIIIVTIFRFLLRYIVNKISKGKKSYSQFIRKQLSKPFFSLIFFIGLITAVKSLTTLENLTISISEGNYEVYKLVNGLLFIIGTFIISWVISRIITILMLGWLKVRKGFQRTPGLLNKATTVFIFVIAVIIILGYFEIDITPVIAGVGLGALAIGLALQSTLANFFAGIHLLSDRPIDVGDFIELDENTSGIVDDIGWRSTRIKTLTNNLLIIPNGKLADSNITNYSKPKQNLSLWVPCGVAYESDLEKVEKVSLEVAKEIQISEPGALTDFEPLFRFREFGDSNINFITILGIKDPLSRFVVRNQFIKALKKRYDKEGIEISWPIRKLYNIK